MTLKRGKVERALESKGFMRRPKKHIFFVYHTRKKELKTSVWTMMSHGNSGADVSRSLSAKMARQCRINKTEFERLIDCSLSQEAYENLLVNKKVIEAPNAANQ